MPITITAPAALDPAAQRAVRDLAASIEQADGAPPLSDQALSQLTSDAVEHRLAVDAGRVTGYAQLAGDTVEVLATEDAVNPLLDAVESARARVEIWAHGRRSRLLKPLADRSYERSRVLWQLRWPVTELDDVPLAAGITLRTFVAGQDETAWLAVNAAAFAHHPEQGGWGPADIRERERETWFDPADFLLAERDGELLGFHWMKMHTPTLGEVYVLGVSPGAQGLGLGSALLVAGLNHLRGRGVTGVLLYVDDSNVAAMHLYERYGFARYDCDVQYVRRPEN